MDDRTMEALVYVAAEHVKFSEMTSFPLQNNETH